MVDQVKLEGLSDIIRKLKALPKAVQDRELYRSLRAGAKPMLALARSLAPRGESKDFMRRGKSIGHTGGKLASNIVIRREKKKFLRDRAMVRIGVLQSRRDKDSPFYWRFVEFGTSKQRARPFLVPAFEALKVHSSNIIRNELLKGVERQAKRLK